MHILFLAVDNSNVNLYAYYAMALLQLLLFKIFVLPVTTPIV